MDDHTPRQKPARSAKPRVGMVPRSPRVIVAVDAQTINSAIVRNSSHCMIAEAVKKAVPYADVVMVDLQSIRFTDKDRALRYSYLTPRVAQLALIKFDQGERPRPFTITLSAGAVRRAVHRVRSANMAMPLDRRTEIIARFQAARAERGLSLPEIADQIDVAPGSLERYVSASSQPISVLAGEKMLAWVENRKGPGRPRAVPASRISGRARLRKGDKGEGSAPEVIGGLAPPVGNIARRRGFGLHSMVV